MMVMLWTRKREMGDADENNMEDPSQYDKSGVRLVWLYVEDIVSVLFEARLRMVPAISGMVNWLAQEILLSLSCSWWFPTASLVSLFVVLNSTIT